MSPDDLAAVLRSWAELACQRTALLDALTREFGVTAPEPIAPAERAQWLFDAVEALVSLLPAPSRLETKARAIGETWPDPLTAPSFRIEGRAWLDAAAACLPDWTEHRSEAWRQAWLLLSDVLAAEALSPFSSEA